MPHLGTLDYSTISVSAYGRPTPRKQDTNRLRGALFHASYEPQYDTDGKQLPIYACVNRLLMFFGHEPIDIDRIEHEYYKVCNMMHIDLPEDPVPYQKCEDCAYTQVAAITFANRIIHAMPDDKITPRREHSMAINFINMDKPYTERATRRHLKEAN